MENKITLRNRYIRKIQEKLADVKKSVDLLSEIDNAILNQSGGAADAAAGAAPAVPQVNLQAVQNAIGAFNDDGDGVRQAIAQKTEQITTGITDINTRLTELLAALNTAAGDLTRRVGAMPVPGHNLPAAGPAAGPGGV